jgi:tRNA-2-methylthio-N6-dimethylallyladenosine synthase
VSGSRRFWLRTYGCQMNVHDSEKVANLLFHYGYSAADDPGDADLLIVNTCSIRDKAAHRLYSDLGTLRAWKADRPGRVLGVGGCVAQQEGDGLLRRFSQVDFVFGTHNLRWVPTMAEAATRGERIARLEESGSPERFDFPERHPDLASTHPGRAYVTVMEGCDLFCRFCIVPQTRGREISRSAGAIMAEAETLAAGGTREITLLGQTVNAYGRQQIRKARSDGKGSGTLPFAALLRRLAAVPGLARIRYTSPHPVFYDDDLIRVHGELPALCPHIHLPVQSGSDAVLARMRRRYGVGEYLRLVARLREARPDLALTTDLIVGFPGETTAEFRDTLALVREVRFVDSFSFKYSPRPGTAAAGDRDGVPEPVAQARLEELQTLQRELTLAAHRARVGETAEVLVEGPSRRGGEQRAGRDRYHRIVNFAARAGAEAAPGALVPVQIVEATPHSLIGEVRTGVGHGEEAVKNGPARADEHWQSAISGV